MKKRAADIIMETLVENGITDAFCVVGGGAMFLNNALALNKNIKTIFNHHEQACAMAAEGYAKFSEKKPALVCVTSGPGGTNALTGVMGAYQDSAPMIVISGQIRYETTVAESGLNLRRRGEQEFDIINSVKNMTKYAKMVIDPLSIKQEVKKAIDIAMNGRRGPVWLDIPLNVQSAMVEEEELLPVLAKPEILKCSAQDFEKILSMLKEAKSPCILAGSGIRTSGQRGNFLKILDKWQIPAVSASLAADVLYREHELFFGSTGIAGTRAGNIILQNADVILVLACSLGFKQTGFVQETFAPNAKIIMVDTDADEPKKKGLRVNTFVNCDIKDLFEKINSGSQHIKSSGEWLKHCKGLKEKFDIFENALPSDEGRVNAYGFWKDYFYSEPENNITILGNNSGVGAKLQNGVLKKGQRVIANINCGSMGYDIPAAIGAAAASGKEVILVTGDGSFMMNMQELQTIVYNKLPVKIVIFSNDGYRGIAQTCKNYFNSKNVGCTPESGISMPDFSKVAAAFGFDFNLCKTDTDVKNKISWLFEQKGFCIMEVLQQYDNPASPRVMSKLNADGTSAPAALHDMYPFLDSAELSRCFFNK
ncbi:MAG: thiamine pyrophosphate-binding protein [Endomicrobium sp.]|jgi:acetolactate synthase-1/2/3 large subunit|nr:thiamine pyrophosphate-binding protein [Endomicrobium sp.]